MVEKIYPMTLGGKERLEKELEELKTVKCGGTVGRTKIVHGLGDLSGNSEYESVKDEQALVGGRITAIENMIHFVQIIDNGGIDADKVSIGKIAAFIELPGEDEEEYTIAGSAEAGPFSGEISNDSPIAQALTDKRKNGEVTTATPGGDMLVKIVKVEQV